MPFWTKEREAGVWDFKGKVHNSQVDERANVLNKFLLSHPERMGSLTNRPCSFLSATLGSCYARMKAPFL